MIGLPELKAANNRPRVIRDNFNRDSSFVESSKGYVIHSGIHRSTAFISKTDHPDCAFAFQYWKAQGQPAVNGFIESLVENTHDLEAAERTAFIRSRPEWTVREVKAAGASKSATLEAETGSGGLRCLAGASTWRHLHARTA